MSERGRKPPRESRLGPASRAFLQMSSGEAALEGEETSGAEAGGWAWRY